MIRLADLTEHRLVTDGQTDMAIAMIAYTFIVLA